MTSSRTGKVTIDARSGERSHWRCLIPARLEQPWPIFLRSWLLLVWLTGGLTSDLVSQELEPLKYRHPELVVDLGVGLWAWPLPMDYDQDGDLDLVVVCPDKPSNGTYFFENTGRYAEDTPAMPIFAPARRLGHGRSNVQLSRVAGQPLVTTPEQAYPDFLQTGLDQPRPLGSQRESFHPGRVRANQWKVSDLNGDGRDDLVVGIGDWNDYGWDDGFDSAGQWTRGPLRGFVYWLPQLGTLESPRYGEAQQLTTSSGPIDVYGMPSPNFEDWDGDGDLDLICGEFLDGFTYFQNVGDVQTPSFAEGVKLQAANQQPLAMDLQMIVPVSIDWDRDGDFDLVVGDEDGRVAWCEMLRVGSDGSPIFAQPRYFQQVADRVKFGALVTPVSIDWDRDGDEDLICGNTAGYVGWIENLDGAALPKWAAPKYLEVGGKPLRIQAGAQGSIQGPCEAKWGYTTLSVADWNHDSVLDLIVNSIWGRVDVYLGIADQTLAVHPSQPVLVSWASQEPPKPEWTWWQPTESMLATQWRTTPTVLDWNCDGLSDLIMLDPEGYLAFYARHRTEHGLRLKPPRRIFHATGPSVFDAKHNAVGNEAGPLRLNGNRAGGSGRRKLCWGDWNRDGHLDLFVNSTNIDWFAGRPNAAEPMTYELKPEGAIAEVVLAGHTTSPTLVDWDGDGVPALLIGAEDGFLYLVSPTVESDREP